MNEPAPQSDVPLRDTPPGEPSHDEPVVEPEPAEEMTPQQRAEAKEYHRVSLVCDLADRMIDFTYLAIFALVVARPLDDWLAQQSGLASAWVRLAAFFVLVTVGQLAVSFPLSVYSGYLLEHRYGLSRQSLARWGTRYLKRNLLALALGAALVQGLYWLIWLTGPWWWVLAAAGFFLLSVVLGQLVPVLILPIFYKIERLDDPQLAERFARLASGTGLSITGIYRMEMSRETVKANAMLAGLGRTRRVILGDTLLDGFVPDEIEVILAHEIGHHVHRHIPKLIMAGLAFSTVGFFLCDRFLAWWVISAAAGPVDYSALPVWALPLLLLAITLFSQAMEPLQNLLSRRFERQADRYALNSTGKREAYVSAFHKLARLNKSDPDPHPVEVFLLHSHPPISERLALAERSS